MPVKALNSNDAPPEETRPDPLRKASEILGFEPSRDSDIQKLIDEYEALFIKSGRRHGKGAEFTDLLDKIETSIVREYQIRDRQTNAPFCPLRLVEDIPVDSDVSAHFGVETFRLPSRTECKESARFSDYINKLDEHAEIAHNLELTASSASLTYFKTTCELRESWSRRIDGLVDALHKDRDETEMEKTIWITPKAMDEDEGRVVHKAVFSAQKFLASFPRIPALVIAAAVAVVLVVILVVPWGGKSPVVGLSGEAWNKSGSPTSFLKDAKLIPPEVESKTPKVLEPKVATILYFKDFVEPPKQEWINQLYADLKPVENLRKSFYFISPRDIEEAVKSGVIKTDSRDKMLDSLRRKLWVSNAIIIKVIKVSEGFRLEGEFINLEDGQIHRSNSDKSFDDAAIGIELKNILSTLLSKG
jgi:hypothetical protein